MTPTNPTQNPPKAGPLDYEGLSMLMTDSIFRGRIKVSLLRYAQYIVNEPSTVDFHNTRQAWAVDVIKFPDQKATELHPAIVMQDAVIQQGADISDAELQTTVEGVINKLM